MKTDTLLETIRCEEGIAYHLPYHQKRLETSLHALGTEKTFNLQELINPPEHGVYRCRFLYNSENFSFEYLPYEPRKISSLKLIFDDTVTYDLKYAKRDHLNLLYAQRGECDDILIVKKGLLTDTTIANIALLIDNQWLTPADPLLYGTTRARLIDDQIIFPATLQVDDLRNAKKIALMNAMIGFVELENGIMA